MHHCVLFVDYDHENNMQGLFVSKATKGIRP